MIHFRLLFGQSLIILVLVIFFTCALIYALEIKDSFKPAVYGIVIAYFNALIGYALISWGFTRSTKKFFLSVFGGMILRFLLILLFLLLLIGAFEMDEVPLVSSLIAAYSLFLGLEVFHVHKMMVNKEG